MSLTEIIEGMARGQRSEADELMRGKLAQLYQDASAKLSTSDLAELADTEAEIGNTRQEIGSRLANAQALTGEILPELLQRLSSLGLSEPPVEFMKQILEEKSALPMEPKNGDREFSDDNFQITEREHNKFGLTEKQSKAVRVIFRLTDNPGERVTARDMVREVFPGLDDEGYKKITIQTYGNWRFTTNKMVRLMEPFRELIFPLTSEQIQNLEVDKSIKDLLERIGRIPRYEGLNFTGVLEYCQSLNHKPANLLESLNVRPEMSFTDEEKLFWAYRLYDSESDGRVKRPIGSFLQRQTGSVNLPANRPVFQDKIGQSVYDKLSRYIFAAGGDEADRLFDEMDADTQILAGATVARLRKSEPDSLEQDLAEILKLDITSLPSDTL